MTEVPSRWDLTISDGSTTKGYVLYRGWTGGDSANAPQKAIHSYSPVFVPRTNVQGNYGDDSEDFFMTFSQKDWSLGEQQRHAIREESATRKYWIGENIDITKLGRVSLRREMDSVTFAADVHASTARWKGDEVFTISDSNVYRIDEAGSITSINTHGAATADSIVWDGTDLYINALRKLTLPNTFAAFSSDAGVSLVYHNNALYGTDRVVGSLSRWSSAGTITNLHTVPPIDGSGSIVGQFDLKDHMVASFGGKLLAALITGVGPMLVIYDGVGVSKVSDFPLSFRPKEIHVDFGIAFIGGYFRRFNGATEEFRPAIYFYTNGTLDIMWESEAFISSKDPVPAMASFERGLLFTDGVRGALMFYNPTLGGTHTVGKYTSTTSRAWLSSVDSFALLTQNSTSAYIFPDDNTFNTSGFVTSSLIDFDSSLTKIFRGIKVDYDEGSDGDGGSVDIAYRLDDLDGSYTTLQAGAVSGTEYEIGTVGTPITGRSISYKITLNKGTSTAGPSLKRVYIRAAPQVVQRHRGLYHIDCTAPESGQVTTNDHTGQAIPRSGRDMVMELREFADSGTLLAIHDPLHEFTGVVELLEITQVASNDDPGYVVTLGVREV